MASLRAGVPKWKLWTSTCSSAVARLQRLWVALGSHVLLVFAPWRHLWFQADVAYVRPFHPELEETACLPLPLPAYSRSPPGVPLTLLPLAHICLMFADIVMLPLVIIDGLLYHRLRRTGAVPGGQWNFVLPRLTIDKQLAFAGPNLWQVAIWMGWLVSEEWPTHGNGWPLSSKQIFRRRARSVHALLLSYAYMVLLWFQLMQLLALSSRSFGPICTAAFLLASCFSRPLLKIAERRGASKRLEISSLCTLAAVKAVSKCRRTRQYWRSPPRDGSCIRAYHGTSQENALGIRLHGLKPSKDGMLGRGVYFSRDLNKTLAYCGSDGVILEMSIDVGAVCVIDAKDHRSQKTWGGKFDTAWVPARCGMVASGLEEGCVENTSRVKVLRAWPKHQLLLLLFRDILLRQFEPVWELLSRGVALGKNVSSWASRITFCPSNKSAGSSLPPSTAGPALPHLKIPAEAQCWQQPLPTAPGGLASPTSREVKGHTS